MPADWIKQTAQLNLSNGLYLNDGAGDSVIGGLMTGVPSGIAANQGIQSIPGDRLIISEADAAALSDTVSVGTLYGGLYQYVRTKLLSTATPTINRAVFWDTGVAASQFQVTPDESGSQGVGLFAGVCINTLTKGNSWWIQVAGCVTVLFRGTALTGIAADGCAVFLAGAGAGVDVLNGAGNPTFTQSANMCRDYVGVAQGAPAFGTASLVNIPLGRMFRW